MIWQILVVAIVPLAFAPGKFMFVIPKAVVLIAAVIIALGKEDL